MFLNYININKIKIVLVVFDSWWFWVINSWYLVKFNKNIVDVRKLIEEIWNKFNVKKIYEMYK